MSKVFNPFKCLSLRTAPSKKYTHHFSYTFLDQNRKPGSRLKTSDNLYVFGIKVKYQYPSKIKTESRLSYDKIYAQTHQTNGYHLLL